MPIPPFFMNYSKEQLTPVIQQLLLQMQQSTAQSHSPKVTISHSPELSKPGSSPIPRSLTPPANLKKKKKAAKPPPPPVKRIITPDWIDAALPTAHQPCETPNFDIVSMHRRLELFESRIQSGADTRYQHPAMSREAAELDPDPILTEEELIKVDRYEDVNLPPVVPRFWPHRMWDDQILDDRRTGELVAEMGRARQVQLFEKSPSFPSPPKKLKSPVAKSPKKQKSEKLLPLSTESFATDSDETDGGEF
jgi:hypothetical protein